MPRQTETGEIAIGACRHCWHITRSIARCARHLGDRRLDVGRNRRNGIDCNDPSGGRPRHQSHRYRSGLWLRPFRSNFSVGQMERFRRVAPLDVLQPPYNLLERDIEADILPYCQKNKIATFGYGALCRGAFVRPHAADGDDLRRTGPKFQQPRFAQYLAAVARLYKLAQQRFRKHVIHLAIRWMLDQGITTALWGARRQPQPVGEVSGWELDA